MRQIDAEALHPEQYGLHGSDLNSAYRMIQEAPTITADPSHLLIDLSEDDDFGAILICAERYALGRQTYMPKLVMDFIRPLIPKLTNKTLGAMERDLTSPTWGYGDPDIDEPEWLQFLASIRDELRSRKDSSSS